MQSPRDRRLVYDCQRLELSGSVWRKVQLLYLSFLLFSLLSHSLQEVSSPSFASVEYQAGIGIGLRERRVLLLAYVWLESSGLLNIQPTSTLAFLLGYKPKTLAYKKPVFDLCAAVAQRTQGVAG